MGLNPYAVISLAAVAISALALIGTLMISRRKEGGDYLGRVEDRNDRLMEDLERCNNRCKDLIQENIELLRKLAGVRHNRRHGNGGAES